MTQAVVPTTKPERRLQCPYSVEIAVAADDAWEVFVDGTKVSPTNGSLENDWRVPASYKTTIQSNGTELVIGIHAKDVSGVISGLLANVRVTRQNPPSSFPSFDIPTGNGNGWQAFKHTVPTSIPPANWNSAPYLPYASATAADWAPATLASACTGIWGGSAAFLNEWAKVSGGAAPTDWVWEYDCKAASNLWRKENWYRLDVPLDYCPIETPPAVADSPCCAWAVAGHGLADGLFDVPPSVGCTTDASSAPPSAVCIDRVGCGWVESLCKYRCGFDFWNWSCIEK